MAEQVPSRTLYIHDGGVLVSSDRLCGQVVRVPGATRFAEK
jgi:hypothetical protein